MHTVAHLEVVIVALALVGRLLVVLAVLVLVSMAVTVMVHLLARVLRMLVLVVVVVVLVLHRLLDLDGRLVDLLVVDFLLLDDRRFVVVVHGFGVRVRVLVVLLLDGNVDDDLLLFDVPAMNG